MANAAIAFTNLADAGTLSASSQEFSMTVLNLQDPYVSRRWRSQDASASFILDLGAGLSIDTIGVFGVTVGAAGTARVRLSLTDSSGLAGDVADSGSLVSGGASFDAAYDAAVYLLPAPLVARYVRVDLFDPDADYVEAGRLFVGARTAFTYNFSLSQAITTVDRSKTAKTRGGQTLAWNDNQFRRIDLAFDWVTEAQRYGMVEVIDRINGLTTDVLLITDPDSTNLARDSVWGLISEPTPVTRTPFFDTFGKQYKLEERL